MSKILKVLGLVAVVGLVIGVGASAVYAQEATPWTPRGTRGPGGGGMGPVSETGESFFQIDQEAIHQELADLLGIGVEQMESALENGETLFSLASSYEVDFEELRTVLSEAHAAVLAEAVLDRKITQEQADWILERQGAMGAMVDAPVGTGYSGGGIRRSGSFARGILDADGSCWSTVAE